MDVKTLCLAVLSRGNASGYEIKKELEEGPIGYFHHAGFGSIYPALNKLYEAGHVTWSTQTQDGRPDKKIYAITEEGRAELRRALDIVPAPDRYRSDAMLQMFFCSHLSPDNRERVFDSHRDAIATQLARMSENGGNCEKPGPAFVNGMGQTVYRAIIEFMDANKRAFLEEADAAAHEQNHQENGSSS